MDGHGDRDEQDQRQPEEIVIVEVVDDRPGEHDPGAAADTEERRHQPDPAGDALSRKLVPDDPEREREETARRALDHAADKHHDQRRGDRGDHRPETEEDEHDDEQPLLAVHVPEPADQRRPDRRAEQIRGQHPADGVDRGVELLLKLR